MKVSNIRQMQRLDPEDVVNAPGDKERESRRKTIIKNFLWWSRNEKDRWNT